MQGSVRRIQIQPDLTHVVLDAVRVKVGEIFGPEAG